MNKNKNISSLILSIIFVVIGLFAIIAPNFIKDSISTIIGVLLIVSGVLLFLLGIVAGRGINPFNSGISFIISGIIAIILGVIVLNNKQGTLNVIMIIFGGYIFLTGLYKIIISFYIERRISRLWLISLIVGIIYLVLAISMFVYPERSSNVFIILIGIYFLTLGLSKLINTSLNFKNKDNDEDNVIHNENTINYNGSKHFDENTEVIDAEIIDDKDKK